MDFTITKRTVAPLFDFRASPNRPYDLGVGVILRPTDHAAIQQDMDAYLGRFRVQPPEGFRTYLSPHERTEFAGASFCLEHQFEAPDYLGESEELSKSEIIKVVTGMRVLKPTLVRPGLFLGWEKREEGWMLRGFQKGGFDTYMAPGENPETFRPRDIAALAGILAQIRQAYTAHSAHSFNRVANALNFCETGYRANWWPVRFVVFTTALESLFVTSDRATGWQFRERIPRFLTTEASARTSLETMCRSIYSMRSDVVHGQPVPNGLTSVNTLLREVQEICRRTLSKILGDANLFTTFCGASQALGQYLDQLP